MPTKRDTAQDLIDRVRQLRLAGQVDDAEALRKDAEDAVQACAPRDRKAMSAALEHAYGTEPPGAVKIRSYHDVAGVDELVDKGVAQARDAVDAGLKTADMARQIAETLLEARLKMTNKAGLPDISAASKYTKNIAHDLFVKAREGINEEDVDRWATHRSLAKAVRNRMSDVVVTFLRSLDSDTARFEELFPQAKARFPEKTPTEAVYALYEAAGFKLPRKGRTEIARDQAREKAARLRALEAGVEPDAADLAGAEELAADLQALERMEKSFTRMTDRAQKLPETDRKALKARINETIATLAARAASL